MAFSGISVAALPLLATLAGAGLIATAVATKSEPAAPQAIAQPVRAPVAAVEPAKPCAEQAWPNIDRACLTTVAASTDRDVRVVTPPRPSEGFTGKWAALPQSMRYPSATASDNLKTGDTVLRAPQSIEKLPDAPAVAAKPRPKREAKRKTPEPRYTVQQYQVPAEQRAYGYAERPVAVYRRAGPFNLFD